MNRVAGLELPESAYGVRRKWWLAALFSLFLPGLGQVYNGQLMKGIIFCAASWVVGIVALFLMWELSYAPLNLVLDLLVSLLVLILILRDAILVARSTNENFKPRLYSKWYLCLVIALFFIFIFWPAIDKVFYDVLSVPSEVMRPTIEPGDRIIADRFAYRFSNPERGDIAIFKFPLNEKQLYVKRIIGLPGDTLEIRDKQVIINGISLTENYTIYLDSVFRPGRDYLSRTVIPQNKYFALGDNRDNSYDSRFWGFVDRDKIISKVRNVLFSWDAEKKRLRWDRFGARLST